MRKKQHFDAENISTTKFAKLFQFLTPPRKTNVLRNVNPA